MRLFRGNHTLAVSTMKTSWVLAVAIGCCVQCVEGFTMVAIDSRSPQQPHSSHQQQTLGSSTLQLKSTAVAQAVFIDTELVLTGSSKPKPELVQISIEFSKGSGWDLRAVWMAQELLRAFADVPALQAITLLPSLAPGVFRVTSHDGSPPQGSEILNATLTPEDIPDVLLWERTDRTGLPELDVLKKLVQEQLNSDIVQSENTSKDKGPVLIKGALLNYVYYDDYGNNGNIPNLRDLKLVQNHITISYTSLYPSSLLRASYMAQKVLQEQFAVHDPDALVRSVSLVPRHAKPNTYNNKDPAFYVHLQLQEYKSMVAYTKLWKIAIITLWDNERQRTQESECHPETFDFRARMRSSTANFWNYWESSIGSMKFDDKFVVMWKTWSGDKWSRTFSEYSKKTFW